MRGTRGPEGALLEGRAGGGAKGAEVGRKPEPPLLPLKLRGVGLEKGAEEKRGRARAEERGRGAQAVSSRPLHPPR